MANATKQQLQKIHIMLTQLGLQDEKLNLVFSISKGRTASSKLLTIGEAQQLIKYLVDNDPGQKMRKKIFALAYDAGIIWGNSDADKKMNIYKLNQFLLSSGTVKKELNKMEQTDLVRTVSQFEKIIKNQSNSTAKNATKNLLQELNIPVEKQEQYNI